ncbi:uncharacterized protein LOC123682740 [Harmonia axyridis]|uniref:uncharacterized protein LOC123682740 n=1 Tax=Harmonia axyridis TaxID=115357 RepID=UPI001E277F6E|nr:uncharacterized protein LOC123682740 [Harmonia axyridis]XP_045477466.1 uncharacterized protein LOC123682740 [Harmonia axyridis]
MSDDLSHETLDDSYMNQSEEDIHDLDTRNEHQNSIPSLAKVGIVNEYLTKGTLNDVHKAIASDDLGQNQSQNIHGVDMVATNSNGQLEKDDVGTSRVEDTSRPEENGENLERKDGCLSPDGKGPSGIVDDDDNEMEVENAVEVPIENAFDSQENQLKLRTPSKMQEAPTKNPIGIPEDGGKFSEEEKRYQMVTSSLQSRRAEEKKTANKRHPPCRRRPIRKCLFPYDI